jgi:hypothetical protein
MHGSMNKHEFFAERDDVPERAHVAPEDTDSVPVWCGWDFPQQVRAALARPGGKEFRCTFGPERNVTVNADALGRHFLGAIDARQTVGSILDAARSVAPAMTSRQIMRRWVEFFAAFNAVAALTLYASES